MTKIPFVKKCVGRAVDDNRSQRVFIFSKFCAKQFAAIAKQRTFIRALTAMPSAVSWRFDEIAALQNFRSWRDQNCRATFMHQRVR
jgi:hypothetical protein